jgi:hypothetical protein
LGSRDLESRSSSRPEGEMAGLTLAVSGSISSPLSQVTIETSDERLVLLIEVIDGVGMLSFSHQGIAVGSSPLYEDFGPTGNGSTSESWDWSTQLT